MTLQSPRVVLVIEDESNIVNVIEHSLVGMYIEVVSAENGETGVELAAQLQPDLILLDLALPGITGWEVLEEVRATPHGATVPVVVVTAHGDSATAVQARESGANEFLSKPFLPTELRRLVEKFVASSVPKSA